MLSCDVRFSHCLLLVGALPFHRPDIAGESIRVTGVFSAVKEKLVVEYDAEVSAAACPRRFTCLPDPMLSVRRKPYIVISVPRIALATAEYPKQVVKSSYPVIVSVLPRRFIRHFGPYLPVS